MWLVLSNLSSCQLSLASGRNTVPVLDWHVMMMMINSTFSLNMLTNHTNMESTAWCKGYRHILKLKISSFFVSLAQFSPVPGSHQSNLGMVPPVQYAWKFSLVTPSLTQLWGWPRSSPKRTSTNINCLMLQKLRKILLACFITIGESRNILLFWQWVATTIFILY